VDLLVRWALNALALYLTALGINALVPGSFTFSGAWPAVGAALLLGVVNAVLRPLALLLTLPVNILTFGLFTFVVNAAMLYLVAAVVPGFQVQGFGAALLGAVVLTVVSAILGALVRRS
jgi:putative membrane protein